MTSRVLSILGTGGRRAVLGGMLGVAVLRDLLRIKRRKKQTVDEAAAGNIVIIGANRSNKGAEAMLFTVVDQMKRRFPNRNVYLFSLLEFQKTEEEKRGYRYSILPWDQQTRMALLGIPGDLRGSMSGRQALSEMHARVRVVIENAHCFIDISGYALSSQWGFFGSIGYLMNIMIAKRFSVPYYILPQSMGPFNYSLLQRLVLYPLLRLYLPYPVKVFVREEDGLKWVRRFTRKNVEGAHDIVLTNPGYDLANIYVGQVEFRHIDIARGSVAVIPNRRVLERTGKDTFNSLYCAMIRRLLIEQKRVYLLRHSYEDLAIVEELGSFFRDENRVQVVRDDMSAIEFERLVEQFDFIVASRYHAIVHAYKKGVPALVIGWATKYLELLDDFGQLEYFFDCRGRIDVAQLKAKLDKMIQEYMNEGERITNKMSALSGRENPFDVLFGSMKQGVIGDHLSKEMRES